MNNQKEIIEELMGHELTDADFSSETWRKIEKHLRNQLDYFHNQNDNPLPPDETNLIRGQIRHIKSMLNMREDTDFLRERISEA